MTDRLPVRKMNPVHGGTWAGIDVEDLLRERHTIAIGRAGSHGLFPFVDLRIVDLQLGSKYGIDVASIRRLAGEL